MNDWKERRNELKLEICNYFQGLTKEKLIEILDFIRKISDFCINSEMGVDKVSECDCYFDSEIRDKFSPKHRSKVREFCDRTAELDLELKQFLDSQRWWKDPKNNWARDDFEYEDYLDSCPKAEVLIKFDEIIVSSFEWQEGFKNCLPKEGEYLGKNSGKWKYPLTARSHLEKLGLPIIKYPGVE